MIWNRRAGALWVSATLIGLSGLTGCRMDVRAGGAGEQTAGVQGAEGAQASAGAETMPLVTEGQIAPLLSGLGDHHMEIKTDNERAQVFFDQGLRLSYAFNHAEAVRSFQEAQRLDPECAMCYWGEAWALGPNINAPMSPDAGRQAYAAVQKAQELKGNASEREQAYIDALAQRYSADPENEDRAALDKAFAEAMGNVAERYPEDLDAATIHAEALMDTRPWNYWTREGKPYEETVTAVEEIERVLVANPDHPGALHYYIHMMELPYPERAEPIADRLSGSMPAAGHLEHMPAHIYMRVGRWKDSFDVNEKAVAADEAYLTQCRMQGIYPVGYYPHNMDFVWVSAAMEGRKKEALETAHKIHHQADPEVVRNVPLATRFLLTHLFAMDRFGMWDEIKELPEPESGIPFETAMWHYGQGRAAAHTGETAAATNHLDALQQIAASDEMQGMMLAGNAGGHVLEIAEAVLKADIAEQEGRMDEAIAHLDRAVRLEDGLNYMEPSDWHLPVRHLLGAALLKADRPDEAEVVYWEDLKRLPHNGWALLGVTQALEAQGKTEEAAAARERFEKAWERADVEISSSRIQ